MEDHAHGVAAVAGEFDGINGGEVAAADVDSSRRGTVKPSQEIQKGGLARPRATEERDEFAGADFERDVVDGGDGGVAEMVVAGDVLGLDEGSVGLVGGGHGCGWPEVVLSMVMQAGRGTHFGIFLSEVSPWVRFSRMYPYVLAKSE